MDSEEEKTSQSSSLTTYSHDAVSDGRFSGSVSLDLVWEILSRLPAKSVVRSSSVSKLWSSITTDSSFINSFPARSTASNPRVLVTFRKGETRYVFSFPKHQNPNDPNSQVDRYEMVNPSECHFTRSNSVHGLVFFETLNQLMVWNPTMRRFSSLPQPKDYVRGFLGYDPVECKYKVISFLTDARISVLTLGSQEPWKMIKASHVYFPLWSCSICINGVLYYKTLVNQKHDLVSFDIRLGTFNLVQFPLDGHDCCVFLAYEGRLALVNSMASGVEIWILEDAKNRRWSSKHFYSYPPSEIDWMCISLKGVTNAGELVYTPKTLYDSFNVVYFDLKRKSIRETKFEGILDGMFRGLKGLGFGTLHNLDVFPNHIESLFSL